MIGCFPNSLLYIPTLLFVIYVSLKIFLLLRKTPCTCKTNLTGKTVVITGGNTGIGLETAKILARRGARVVIASRNVAKSQAAVNSIIDSTGNPLVECKALDLGSLASVKRFADDFNASYDRLDVLINNAGYSDLNQVKSEDGIERVMQVNHVAPVYLTNLLLDKIVSSKPSRIIFVSSEGHKFSRLDPEDLVGDKPQNTWTRYCNTKLCNVLSAKALAKRVPKGVTVNAVHPGTSLTEIFDVLGPIQTVSQYLVAPFLKTAEDCAQTSVHVAMSPFLADVTGQYFKNCKIKLPSPLATDELAEIVWDKTLAMIKDRTSDS